jgi:hypothetical protein
MPMHGCSVGFFCSTVRHHERPTGITRTDVCDASVHLSLTVTGQLQLCHPVPSRQFLRSAHESQSLIAQVPENISAWRVKTNAKISFLYVTDLRTQSARTARYTIRFASSQHCLGSSDPSQAPLGGLRPI